MRLVFLGDDANGTALEVMAVELDLVATRGQKPAGNSRVAAT